MLTSLSPSQLNNRNNAYPLFNAATRTEDCNVVLTCTGVELVLGRQISAAQARTAARQAAGPTGNIFAKNVFGAEGITTDKYRLLWSEPTQTVRDLLKSGWFVTLYVDYGVLNTLAPQISADKGFDGFHAIGLSDWFRSNLGASVHDHDPLADGRRPAIPKGIQTAKFSWLRDAAYAYTQKPGFVQGWAVLPKGA